MDVMRILQSLEQFLFEVMMWLIFYPRTMWLALTKPLTTMAYAQGELDDKDEDRYSDTLNPPLFLTLTMALSMGLSTLVEKPEDAAQLQGFLRSKENLLAFYILLFSLFPLVFSVRLVRRQQQALDRKVLRSPFYQQCYVAAPFALLMALASDFAAVGAHWSNWISSAILVLALVWFLWVQTVWLTRQLPDSTPRCFLHAIGAMVTGTVLMLLLSIVAIFAST